MPTSSPELLPVAATFSSFLLSSEGGVEAGDWRKPASLSAELGLIVESLGVLYPSMGSALAGEELSEYVGVDES